MCIEDGRVPHAVYVYFEAKINTLVKFDLN